MSRLNRFYIDGSWVAPSSTAVTSLVDPASEAVIGQVALGSETDVDRAVAAARAAFPGFAVMETAERIRLLERIAEIYRRRMSEMAQAISQEMGAPLAFRPRRARPLFRPRLA